MTAAAAGLLRRLVRRPLLAERLHASPLPALVAIALMAAGTASLALSAPTGERRRVALNGRGAGTCRPRVRAS